MINAVYLTNVLFCDSFACLVLGYSVYIEH